MTRLVIAMIVALVLVRGAAAAEEPHWYNYEPAVVSLKGFLAVKYFYGPPSFGDFPKSDYKAGAWLLFLSMPINIRGEPDPDDGEEETDVRLIQLVVITKSNSKKLWKDLRRSLGREVIVTGSLYQGRTSWYWTNVALELKTIALVPRGNDRE